MNPRDELRMLVLFYVGGVMGVAELRNRVATLVPCEETRDRVAAQEIVLACDAYSAPIKGWNVGELADRDQILVNKLKAAVQ